MPIGSNLYGLVRDEDEDWIWESMVRHPDVGGFNRLDSTILKAGEGTVVAKEEPGRTTRPCY